VAVKKGPAMAEVITSGVRKLSPYEYINEWSEETLSLIFVLPKEAPNYVYLDPDKIGSRFGAAGITEDSPA